MDTLQPTLHNILEKLLITEEIYRKSSSVVHNSSMTVEFDKIATKRRKFFDGLCENLGIDDNDFQIGMAKNIKTQLTKLGMEFDNLMLERNEYVILGLCIKYDEAIIEDYKKILEDETYEHVVRDVALFQLNDLKTSVDHLKQEQKSYDFQHME